MVCNSFVEQLKVVLGQVANRAGTTTRTSTRSTLFWKVGTARSAVAGGVSCAKTAAE
jgi:hypothetical protein